MKWKLGVHVEVMKVVTGSLDYSPFGYPNLVLQLLVPKSKVRSYWVLGPLELTLNGLRAMYQLAIII